MRQVLSVFGSPPVGHTASFPPSPQQVQQAARRPSSWATKQSEKRVSPSGCCRLPYVSRREKVSQVTQDSKVTQHMSHLWFVRMLQKIEEEVAAVGVATGGEKLHPALPTNSVQPFLHVRG